MGKSMAIRQDAVIDELAAELLQPVAPAVEVEPRVEPERRPWGAWLAFASICILWGTTFLAIRIAIETIPTLLVSGARFVMAGAILLVVALATRARFPVTAAEWRGQIVSGVLMSAVGNTLVVYAEHSISSGLAALLVATIPIWMALLESVTGGARLTTRRVAGLTLGFGGVALLVAPAIDEPHISLPFFLAVGATQLSAISWNVGTLYSRRHRARGDATATASIQMLSGGIAVSLVALFTGAHHAAHVSTRSILALLYLVIFGSVVAYSAYVYVLSKMTPGKVSSYAYVNPAIAVVVGAIVLQEAVTGRMVAAMLVILGGVAIIQLEKRR